MDPASEPPALAHRILCVLHTCGLYIDGVCDSDLKGPAHETPARSCVVRTVARRVR